MKDGSTQVTKGSVGSNIMRIAHQYGIELEGACEGVCACSTCHIILESVLYDKLPEPSENEEDMLDQAFGLKATSRLGCQVVVTEELDGMRVQLPAATRNFYVVRSVPEFIFASSSKSPSFIGWSCPKASLMTEVFCRD